MEIVLCNIAEWHILKLFVNKYGYRKAIIAFKSMKKRFGNGLGVQEFAKEL